MRAQGTALSLMALGSERIIYLCELQLLCLKMRRVGFFEMYLPALKRSATEESLELGVLLKMTMIIYYHHPIVEAVHRPFELVTTGCDMLNCNTFYR